MEVLTLEMRCASEVSRTEPCAFSQLLSAIQRGRYRCLRVVYRFWNPSILPGGGLWCFWANVPTEKLQLCRGPTLSGRAKLRGELPRFFISAVRFSFLESCLELSLNKYAKFPVWIACWEAILKGVRGLGKFFSLSGVWCEVGTHLESGWELPAEPPGRQGKKSCPSNQPLSPCSFVLQPGWFPQCTGSLGLRGDSHQLAHSAF